MPTDTLLGFAVLAFLVGCGGGGGAKERAFCERAGKLCADDDFTAKDVRECTAKLPELEPYLGKHYGRMLSCGTESKTCPELAGCVGGAAMAAGEKAMQELEKGFDKMLSGSGRSSHSSSSDDGDEAPLPPECKRFTAVCNPDETMARDKCVELVGNLRADPENRKKLARCNAEAKNCFAFETCTTQLWFDLH